MAIVEEEKGDTNLWYLLKVQKDLVFKGNLNLVSVIFHQLNIICRNMYNRLMKQNKKEFFQQHLIYSAIG